MPPSITDFAHRLYLKVTGGRSVWHQRFYRPGVHVVEASERMWFEEDGLVVEARPLSALGGAFSGRANLVLSGPSVKEIDSPGRLAAQHDLIGVNGSPALFGDERPRMRIYHVNDSSFIRGSLGRFLEYASDAEYTVIDFRGMYELLRIARDRMPATELLVYDSWAYPHRLPLGCIQRLVNPPEHRGVYLSPDLRLGLAVGGTVAYTAAQIAWLGGYDSLYLYGLDLTNSGRFYKESTPHPQMLDKAFENVIQPGFELLVREAVGAGFEVINCNPASRLPATILPQCEANETLARIPA